MLVIMLTSNVGASDDGGDTFMYKTGNATVNVSGLKLRTGPGTDYSVIASISKSQAVKILGQVEDWFAVYDYNTNQVPLLVCRSKALRKNPEERLPINPLPESSPPFVCKPKKLYSGYYINKIWLCQVFS